jgi:hypothetical protein
MAFSWGVDASVQGKLAATADVAQRDISAATGASQRIWADILLTDLRKIMPAAFRFRLDCPLPRSRHVLGPRCRMPAPSTGRRGARDVRGQVARLPGEDGVQSLTDRLRRRAKEHPWLAWAQPVAVEGSAKGGKSRTPALVLRRRRIVWCCRSQCNVTDRMPMTCAG